MRAAALLYGYNRTRQQIGSKSMLCDKTAIMHCTLAEQK